VTSGAIRLALAGDVMLGRGLDQIMRRPGDPALHETWAKSAQRYLELAEERSGPIPRNVDPAYVWGETPRLLENEGVDVCIVNLETAVTARGQPWPGKGIHYRAHPDNANSLVAGGIDVAVLANNHILDLSEPGLEDTLHTLDQLGIDTTGAGRDQEEAWLPAYVGTGSSGRVVVLGLASPSSGVDPAWKAGPGQPGVALLGGLSEPWVEGVGAAVGERRPGDAVVVSIHWGPNWGYHVPSSHQRFARDLIDHAGVDVVHGHSSHHPLGFELYHEGLILYGCGDLLTDYEGIGGHEEYRPELSAWYVVTLQSEKGSVVDLQLVPTKVDRFQLTTPEPEEIGWLARMLEEQGLTPGIGVKTRGDLLTVTW
jgi:poly-gamma-glutamate capsule biosynthesis protein CapA/YwtB (metallophosphatase superfamily)